MSKALHQEEEEEEEEKKSTTLRPSRDAASAGTVPSCILLLNWISRALHGSSGPVSCEGEMDVLLASYLSGWLNSND
ncbi:hypothetical protein EYF80_032424 [Liparis tanakae]|uniref:Uncharacterized protein n=1 Tax=Liparis tanakae TaxID=230148 RepID=A0A4Z2GUX5_9TELE|nr:hypothetical protein EYF80_032424 [Liparis tanakae]